MKKLTGFICLLLVWVTLLSGCGKFVCDVCDEKMSGKKHVEKLEGKKIVYCDRCYKEMKEMSELFK